MKRSTLRSGSLEFSTLAVRKHRVFKPYDRKLSGSTKCSSPSSVIPSGLRQVNPIFHTCHIIFFPFWVGHPSQRDRVSYSFHLGRSPMIMRPHFFIFFPHGQVTHYNETTLHIFSILGRLPLIMRPFLSYSFHLGRSPITMRPFFTHSFVLVK